MKFKETLTVAAVVGSAGLGYAVIGAAENGCFGKKPVATDKSCTEVWEDSKPVEGACLGNEYKSLDVLREKCRGKITTAVMSCDCGGTQAPVWICEKDE